MHVVQQFDFVTTSGADVFEHSGCGFQVGLRVHECVFGQPETRVFEVGLCRKLGRAIATELNADVAKAKLDVLLDALLQLLQVAPAGMRIAIHGEAGFPADELIDRHVRPFALDVPQRHVKPAESVVQHRTIAPIGTRVGVLPKVLDIVRVPAARKRIKILLDGGHHGEWTLVEGGAAEAVQTGLAGLDLHDNQPGPLRRSLDRPHLGDFQRREASGCLGGSLGGNGIRSAKPAEGGRDRAETESFD